MRELAITFLGGARRFYSNSKNGKKGIKNSLIKIEFVLCVWYKIKMENMEEINYYKNLNLFLKASTATKNDLSEYFAPRHIVKTMVRLVNPQIGEKVYDPFCGTGGFLIESFRHIYNNMPRNKESEKMLRENTIFDNK